jgi:hypothetical protein
VVNIQQCLGAELWPREGVQTRRRGRKSGEAGQAEQRPPKQVLLRGPAASRPVRPFKEGKGTEVHRTETEEGQGSLAHFEVTIALLLSPSPPSSKRWVRAQPAVTKLSAQLLFSSQRSQ